jgi:hypothetical protein
VLELSLGFWSHHFCVSCMVVVLLLHTLSPSLLRLLRCWFLNIASPSCLRAGNFS